MIMMMLIMMMILDFGDHDDNDEDAVHLAHAGRHVRQGAVHVSGH